MCLLLNTSNLQVEGTEPADSDDDVSGKFLGWL